MKAKMKINHLLSLSLVTAAFLIPISSSAMEWECASVSDNYCDVMRFRIEPGWLVEDCFVTANCSLTFVPDPKHIWKIK